MQPWWCIGCLRGYETEHPAIQTAHESPLGRIDTLDVCSSCAARYVRDAVGSGCSFCGGGPCVIDYMIKTQCPAPQ